MARNPARSRPLSANVRRLMKAARASPENPNVVKAGRTLAVKDLVYCDMQGSIFMAAVDRGLGMEEFAPLFMRSQLSAVIDFSFFHPGEQNEESLPEYLQVPMLLKSPDLIVDVLLWVEGIVSKLGSDESPRAAVIRALNRTPASNEALEKVYSDIPRQEAALSDESALPDGNAPTDGHAQADAGSSLPSPTARTAPEEEQGMVADEVLAAYEYAYWLGYIYRYESLLHEEASRMVYSVLEEPFMRR